jgi:hypothetical protein
MAMLGLVGGPLVCASGIAVLFGVLEQGSAPQFIATLPEIAWEASLGLWLIFKGFKSSGIEHLQVDRRAVPTPRAVPIP